jgi:hypothetical protein
VTDPVLATVSRIEAAIFATKGLMGEALRAAVGLHDLYPETAEPRASRETIKNVLSSILSHVPDGTPLSTRRVEQLEREVLTPYLAVRLGLVDSFTLPPAWSRGDHSPSAHTFSAVEASSERRYRPIFMQYCNPELLQLSGLGHLLQRAGSIQATLTMASRVALILTDDTLIFPASYVFEVPGFTDFLAQAGPAREAGLFSYVAPVADLQIFREVKSAEYRNDTFNPYKAANTSKANLPGLIWTPRGPSPTAEHISAEWHERLSQESGQLGTLVHAITARGVYQNRVVVDELRGVPERLDGQAFVGRFARAATRLDLSPYESVLLDVFLSHSYLRSYLTDLDATLLVAFLFGDLSCGISPRDGNYRTVPVRPLLAQLERLGLSRYLFRQASWEEFMMIRRLPELPYAIDLLLTITGSETVNRAVAEVGQDEVVKLSATVVQSVLAGLLARLGAG